MFLTYFFLSVPVGFSFGFPNFNQFGQTPSTGAPGRQEQNIDFGQVLGSVVGGFLNPQSQNQNNNILGAVAGFNQATNPGSNGEISGVSDAENLEGRWTSPNDDLEIGRSNASASYDDNSVLGTFYVDNLLFSIVLYKGLLILVLEQEGLSVS